MPKDDLTKNLHKNHRERLRKKFFDSDGDILEPHEILEVLLYSVYAQRDTNQIARMLIKKFGTLYNVFEADKEELLSIPGVGEQAAAMLKLQAALLRRYNIDRVNAPENMKLTPKNAGKYIVNFFHGYRNEILMMFSLDAECKIISSAPVSKGTIDKVQVYVRDIVKYAMETKAVYIILAHNHPNGTLMASPDDIMLTLELEKAFSFINIRLIDHIIVAGDEYISLANEYKIFEKL